MRQRALLLLALSTASWAAGADYGSLIQEAFDNFEDCGERCYDQTVQRALAPWEGISRRLFGRAKAKLQSGRGNARLVRYQIVAGSIYRSHCWLPARCAGVEHFLLGLVAEGRP